MAEPEMVITVKARVVRTRRLDALCSKCWNPSKVEMLVEHYFESGVSLGLFTATFCVDCDVGSE